MERIRYLWVGLIICGLMLPLNCTPQTTPNEPTEQTEPKSEIASEPSPSESSKEQPPEPRVEPTSDASEPAVTDASEPSEGTTDQTTPEPSTPDAEPVAEKTPESTSETTPETTADVPPPPQRTWLNVRYAQLSKAQSLDIYLPPTGNGPFPVVVWVHGGGWQTGTKSLGRNSFQKGVLTEGFALVSVEYRLSGEALFPAQIHDVKTAIRFLRANNTKYYLNTTKIGAWGSSAGGHLVSLLGTSGGDPKLEGEQLGYKGVSSRVQAVIDWYGPISFLKLDDDLKTAGCTKRRSRTDPSSAESKLLGSGLNQVPDLVKQANPETYITKDDPPFMIHQGDKDCTVPYPQSTRFRDALRAVLGTAAVRYRNFPGAEHGNRYFSTADNMKRVYQFFNNTLKTP